MRKVINNAGYIFTILLILFLGSLIHFYLIKMQLEIKYEIKEVAINISLPVLAFIINLQIIITIVLSVILLTKVLKVMPTEKKWFVVSLFLVLSLFTYISAVDNSFQKDPITYYEHLKQFYSFSYIGFLTMLSTTSILLIRERSIRAKICGGLILLFIIWMLY